MMEREGGWNVNCVVGSTRRSWRGGKDPKQDRPQGLRLEVLRTVGG